MSGVFLKSGWIDDDWKKQNSKLCYPIIKRSPDSYCWLRKQSLGSGTQHVLSMCKAWGSTTGIVEREGGEREEKRENDREGGKERKDTPLKSNFWGGKKAPVLALSPRYIRRNRSKLIYSAEEEMLGVIPANAPTAFHCPACPTHRCPSPPRGFPTGQHVRRGFSRLCTHS